MSTIDSLRDNHPLAMTVEVFRQVVDGMDQGILLTGPDQRVGFANAFANNLFGFELTGRTVADIQGLLSSASDGVPHEFLRGEVLVTNPSQERQTRCYLNIAPLSRDDVEDHSLVWTFFELTEEIANTQAFIDFSAELTALNRDLKKKNEEILHLSRTDALTGVANRRSILEVLQKAVDFGNTHASDLSLALFDLDGFHKINDREGQSIGDRILRHVCSLVAEELGPVGTLGRLSGDCFLVIFPGADREQARSFSEEIRVSIQKGTASLGMGLTATIGVVCHRPDLDADQLVASAYESLREGKSAGRNRVIVSA